MRGKRGTARSARPCSAYARAGTRGPEIAAQLFLSEKTSGSQIRSVFDKLGASSRVEVARIVERERRPA